LDRTSSDRHGAKKIKPKIAVEIGVFRGSTLFTIGLAIQQNGMGCVVVGLILFAFYVHGDLNSFKSGKKC